MFVCDKVRWYCSSRIFCLIVKTLCLLYSKINLRIMILFSMSEGIVLKWISRIVHNPNLDTLFVYYQWCYPVGMLYKTDAYIRLLCHKYKMWWEHKYNTIVTGNAKGITHTVYCIGYDINIKINQTRLIVFYIEIVITHFWSVFVQKFDNKIKIFNQISVIQIVFFMAYSTQYRWYWCQIKFRNIVIILWDSEDIKEKCLEDYNTTLQSISWLLRLQIVAVKVF